MTKRPELAKRDGKWQQALSTIEAEKQEAFPAPLHERIDGLLGRFN